MSRRVSLAVALGSILGSGPLSMPVYAQTCEQELARQDAALRQLDADARREGVDFLLDDVRRAALGEVSKRLRGDATADATREIKARWDEYQAYVNQGKTFQSVAERLSQCLRSPQGACVAEIKQSVQRHIDARNLAARIGEAVQKWIESLGNEAISRAVERVERTRGILENFTKRAAGTATQAATQGIESCLRDFDRRARQTQNNSTPVDPRQPPSGGASTPSGRGMSAGKIAALIGIPAAAAVGVGMYAKGAIDEATNTGGGGGGSSNDPSQIRLVGNPTMQCAPISGSLQSLCRAQIMLDVGNVFSAGTQVCIRLDASGFPACQVKGSSSGMTFQIEERSINCPAIQTGIFVYNGPPTGVAATARVTANIPVTCN